MKRGAFVLVAALAALLVATLASRPAAAHAMRTAYLEVTDLGAGRASLQLTASVPVTGLAIPAPEGCTREGDSAVVTCDGGGVSGHVVRVDGIGPLVSEVVVHVAFAGGGSASHVLTASHPAWEVPRATGAESAASALGDYAKLGVTHIFGGVDHLLFLAGLAVALRRLRAILVAETAFTLSHTLTFTASTLGWIHVASAAAEACIAASLVLVALDAARPVRVPLARAAALAFVFGLVHGLGFAGGLADIGLPDRDIGWAVAGFAGGVEAGQVAFLLAFTLLLALVARTRPLRRAGPLLVAYAVGSAGAFLFLERALALVHFVRA